MTGTLMNKYISVYQVKHTKPGHIPFNIQIKNSQPSSNRAVDVFHSNSGCPNESLRFLEMLIESKVSFLLIVS